MNEKDNPDMETAFPVESLNQDADADAAAAEMGNSYEEISSRVEDNHVELDNMFGSHQSQRTSTPSDVNSAFSNGVISINQHVPNNTVEFSPVLDSGDISDSMENSSEVSGSLYTSAQSNMNATDPLDADSTNIVRSLADQGIVDVGNYSECSTGDSAWETAFESEQENSVLKDVTVTGEGESSIGSQGTSDFNDTSNFARTDDGSSKTGPTPPDTIANSAVGDEPNEQQSPQMNKSDFGINLDTVNPVGDTPTSINSPDLDLLNEICEEATSMTIKEALICSLKPEVRAGLSEGRLQLSESDIMVLEQYCEHFIDNLFSDLVNKQWTLEALAVEKGEESGQPLEEKASMARKLSNFGLDTLKTSCDRFVQSIIRESIHSVFFELQEKDDSELPDDERNQQRSERAVLDIHSVEDILPIFQKSETIQQYIGFLSADIIKSALTNLSSTMATTNAEKNVLSNKNNATHFQQTNDDFTTELSEYRQEFWENRSDHEIWSVKIDKKTSVSSGNESCHLITAENSNRDFDEPLEPEMEELSDEESTVCPNFASALETSLEFDTDDWEEGGLFPEPPLLETGSKQKIVLRELSFDEHTDIPGTELLAPVFLAIAEENDDDSEFQGLRKKAQSIEDLCTVIDDKAHEKPKPRSLSAPKIMSLTQPMPDILAEVSQLVEEENELCGSGDEEGSEDDTGKEEVGSEEQVSPKPSLQPSDDAERDNSRYRWHTVTVDKREKMLDLKLLEPYMKVISHGGYFSDTKATIVVIAACYLPERSIRNYNFLMEQLFFYVVSTLELLATHEDYYLVYLNGGTRQDNMPTVGWMKRFYQHVEGGLKKRMKEMFIVHPNFWLKTVIRLAKPFINSGFWRKLTFVSSLESLSSFVPVDYIYIPDEVMRVDPAYRLTHSR